MTKFLSTVLAFIAIFVFGVATVVSSPVTTTSAMPVAACVAAAPTFSGSTSVRDYTTQYVTKTTYVENLVVLSNCGEITLLPPVVVDGDLKAYTPAQVSTAIASWYASNDVLGTQTVSTGYLPVAWYIALLAMAARIAALLMSAVVLITDYEPVTGERVIRYESAEFAWTSDTWTAAELAKATNDVKWGLYERDMQPVGELPYVPVADDRSVLHLLDAIASVSEMNDISMAWVRQNRIWTCRLSELRPMHQSLSREMRLLRALYVLPVHYSDPHEYDYRYGDLDLARVEIGNLISRRFTGTMVSIVCNDMVDTSAKDAIDWANAVAENENSKYFDSEERMDVAEYDNRN